MRRRGMATPRFIKVAVRLNRRETTVSSAARGGQRTAGAPPKTGRQGQDPNGRPGDQNDH